LQQGAGPAPALSLLGTGVYLPIDNTRSPYLC